MASRFSKRNVSRQNLHVNFNLKFKTFVILRNKITFGHLVYYLDHCSQLPYSLGDDIIISKVLSSLISELIVWTQNFLHKMVSPLTELGTHFASSTPLIIRGVSMN